MVRVAKCCCCIPVKTGSYIIGSFHVIGLILGLLMLNPLQVSLEVFCGVTFLMMVYRDSEQKRLFYFTAYVVYIVTLGAIRLFFVFWDHDEKALVRKFCEDVEAKIVQPAGNDIGWKATDYTSLEDCKTSVGHAVLRDELITLVGALLIQAHFALVLYSHYKNAHLSKSRGGCGPDANEAI